MRPLCLILLCACLWSAELVVNVPAYAVGMIAGKEYAVSRTCVYRKSGVFRPVYQLPEPIQAARISQNTIETAAYALSVGKQIAVVKQKAKVPATVTVVSVVVPVVQLTTGNAVVVVVYDGLQLARPDGEYLRLLSPTELTADQLETLRLTFIKQKQRAFSRAERQYVRLLYRLETEKRREGAHDAYPITLPD